MRSHAVPCQVCEPCRHVGNLLGPLILNRAGIVSLPRRTVSATGSLVADQVLRPVDVGECFCCLRAGGQLHVACVDKLVEVDHRRAAL